MSKQVGNAVERSERGRKGKRLWVDFQEIRYHLFRFLPSVTRQILQNFEKIPIWVGEGG